MDRDAHRWTHERPDVSSSILKQRRSVELPHASVDHRIDIILLARGHGRICPTKSEVATDFATPLVEGYRKGAVRC